MKDDGRAELVQRFAFDADQEGDRVAVLLDSDAAALDVSERAAEAVLGILHLLGPRGAPREVDHSGAVLARHDFFRIVVKILADNEDGLAVAVALGIGKRNVSRQRDVAGHLLPE